MIFSSGPFSSVIRNNPIARPDAAAGEGRIAGKDERVERVAVAAKRPFDKAVVGGIAGRREQPPVEEIAPVASSNSYLLREPAGISTYTTTSPALGAPAVMQQR